jgi:hypothetical protein
MPDGRNNSQSASSGHRTCDEARLNAINRSVGAAGRGYAAIAVRHAPAGTGKIQHIQGLTGESMTRAARERRIGRNQKSLK